MDSNCAGTPPAPNTTTVTKPTRSLEDLAAAINREHGQIWESLRRGAEHARRAGDLLIEAKTYFTHGLWLAWLARNCDLSERQAQTYMRLARLAKARPDADLTGVTIKEALKILAKGWDDPDAAGDGDAADDDGDTAAACAASPVVESAPVIAKAERTSDLVPFPIPAEPVPAKPMPKRKPMPKPKREYRCPACHFEWSGVPKPARVTRRFSFRPDGTVVRSDRSR